MSDYAFAAARMAHCADASQIKLADKLSSERRTAGGIEPLENVEMFLNQLGPREGAEIENRVIHGIYAVRTYRNDYVTMTRQHLRNVIIALVTRDWLASVCRAGPLQQLASALETRCVTSVQKNNHGIWSSQSRRIVDGGK